MTSEKRGEASAVILVLAVFADVALRLSAPRAITLSGLGAFLAFLTCLTLLFVNHVGGVKNVGWSAGSLPASFPAVLSVALYGLHPVTIAALPGSVNENLIAALTGTAAGIVICQWSAARWWHAWVCLLPAVPCILLHRAGVAFAPLLAASLWFCNEKGAEESHPQRILRCVPALIVSVLAGFLHRGEGFHPGASAVAFPAMAAGFLAPFAPSLRSGWSAADGLIAFAAVAGLIVAACFAFRLPAVSFGLSWFLVMALLAPAEPLAALPGLALAAVSALLTATMPLLEARPSWLRIVLRVES